MSGGADLPFGRRMALAAAGRIASAGRALQALSWRAELFLRGFVFATHDAPMLMELTRRLNAPSDGNRYLSDLSSGLTAWEQAWLAADLPAPPARVLVGGAGSGREIPWLVARGHEVVAFEPEAAWRAAFRARPGLASPLVTLLPGRYEDLGPGPAPASPLLEALRTRAPFAAVLLGRGSFGHVPDPDVRLEALRGLRALCLTGPILLHYVAYDEEVPTHWARSRSARAGALAGRLFRPRDVAPRPPRAGAQLFSACGYYEELTRSEVDALALGTGSRASVAHSPGVPGHATLWPSGNGAPSRRPAP